MNINLNIIFYVLIGISIIILIVKKVFNQNILRQKKDRSDCGCDNSIDFDNFITSEEDEVVITKEEIIEDELVITEDEIIEDEVIITEEEIVKIRKKHIVKIGDTVSSIAKLYSIDKDLIIKWNNLIDENYIYVGQNLIISESNENTSNK